MNNIQTEKILSEKNRVNKSIVIKIGSQSTNFRQ